MEKKYVLRSKMTKVNVEVRHWRVMRGWNYIGSYNGIMYAIATIPQGYRILVYVYTYNYPHRKRWNYRGKATLDIGQEVKIGDATIKNVGGMIIDFKGYVGKP